MPFNCDLREVSSRWAHIPQMLLHTRTIDLIKMLTFHDNEEIVTLQILRNSDILINYSKFWTIRHFLRNQIQFIFSLCRILPPHLADSFCYYRRTLCPFTLNPFKPTSRFFHSFHCLKDASVFAWGKTYRKWLIIQGISHKAPESWRTFTKTSVFTLLAI